MYYNYHYYPSIFFSSISLDIKANPVLVKKRKNNQCSTLQCKSCLKKKRKNTKYNTSLMSSVFFKITKESLYPTILYIFYISKNLEKGFSFPFFCSPLPSYFFLRFFFLGKWSQKCFWKENILKKISCWSLDCLRNLSLYTSHYTLLCSTIPLLPLYFC